MNWNCLRSGFLLFASLLVVALGLPDAAHANNIYVTSLLDKISAEGGCSLKEAIYSSNFHSNVAVARYTDPISGDPVLISTQCLPGSGNDTIILPTGQVLSITAAVFDANNISGPTATPFITSSITIEGNGATILYAAVLDTDPETECTNDTPSCPLYFRAFAVGNTGTLILRNVHIKGFVTQGGFGADGGNTGGGGGGGMGAGGAIYVQAGNLTVQNSTFESNRAVGGNGGNVGAQNGGGGGGGLAGFGGAGACGDNGARFRGRRRWRGG